jgi:hypothetical protein
MKKVLLLVLALFPLTSCASSPSLDDQIKLVEFDNCIEHLTSELQKDSFTPYERYLKACEKYRP